MEWGFGDGAPGLERERPMLFEQVAKRLIDIEEHEYTLETDETPYVASCQSRFNTPEIIAVLGDVVRRMKMLKGTRAAIGRKGFDADLNILAEATSQDFMEALNIAGPKESMSSALSRPDMPAKIKTALRTLLLSMSDVPGTEGAQKEASLQRPRQQHTLGPAELLRDAKLCRHLPPNSEDAARRAGPQQPPPHQQQRFSAHHRSPYGRLPGVHTAARACSPAHARDCRG